MNKQQEIINEGGMIGNGKGVVNINSKDYKGLQQAIQAEEAKLTLKDKTKYDLIALKLQMQSYITEERLEKIKGSGEFLRDHIKALRIKKQEHRKLFRNRRGQPECHTQRKTKD